MHLISMKRLRESWGEHPDSERPLRRWFKAAQRAQWNSLAEVRQEFPHADRVGAASGRSVIVFNVSGNKYRLITDIQYVRRKVYVLTVLTHARYTKDRWKEQL